MARQIRAESKLDPRRKVSFDLSIQNPWYRTEVTDNLEAISRLAFSELRISKEMINSVGRVLRSTDWFDLALVDDDVLNKPAEIAKLKKDIERLEKDISGRQSGGTMIRNFEAKPPRRSSMTLAR